MGERMQALDPKVPVEGYTSPDAACAARLGITDEHEGGDADALEQRCFEFVLGWRRCLLETVQPKFLPLGWDLHRSIRKHDDLFGPGPPAEPGEQPVNGKCARHGAVHLSSFGCDSQK